MSQKAFVIDGALIKPAVHQRPLVKPHGDKINRYFGTEAVVLRPIYLAIAFYFSLAGHVDPMQAGPAAVRAAYPRIINVAATLFIPAMLKHQALVIAACRSEEHTSELQSLMRISYAVF